VGSDVIVSPKKHEVSIEYLYSACRSRRFGLTADLFVLVVPTVPLSAPMEAIKAVSAVQSAESLFEHKNWYSVQAMIWSDRPKTPPSCSPYSARSRAEYLALYYVVLRNCRSRLPKWTSWIIPQYLCGVLVELDCSHTTFDSAV
jgi:hypothetical protein